MAKSEKSHVIKEVIFLCALGIVIIFAAEFFSYNWLEKDSPYYFVPKFFAHIGVGFFAVGMLGLVIERKHWSDFFQKKIREIVLFQEGAISQLKSDQQKEIKRLLLKQILGNNSVGIEGSFYDHFEENLEKILNDPYRKEVQLLLDIDIDTATDTSIVKENFEWVCCANQNKIQEDVRWVADEGEIKELISTKFELLHEKLPKEKEGDTLFTNPHLNDTYKQSSSKDKSKIIGFITQIKNHENIDNLKIVETIEYKIGCTDMFAWRLSHLTKGIKLTVRYPKGYVLFSQQFLKEHTSEINEDNDKIEYSFVSQDWFLPDQGISFQLKQKNS